MYTAMQITTQIDPDTGFRVHTVTGDLKLDDVRTALEDTYAHPDFRPEAGAVWDLVAATGDISTEEVRHLADFVGKLVGEGASGKVALVVAHDFEFGMARMYESILGGQSSKRFMVFRDMEEATRWVDEDD
jgi:hypothetical protein